MLWLFGITAINLPDVPWWVWLGLLVLGIAINGGGSDPPPPPPPPPPPAGDGETDTGTEDPIVITNNGIIFLGFVGATPKHGSTYNWTGNASGTSRGQRLQLYHDGVQEGTGLSAGNSTTNYSGQFSYLNTSQGGFLCNNVDNALYSHRGKLIGNWFSPSQTFKSGANAATANDPVISSITSSSASISCTFTPNTVHSTASTRIQIRKQGDTTWTQSGAVSSSGTSPVSQVRPVTDLEPLTTYQVQLTGTRTTINATTFTSAIVTFQTLAAAPTVTTNAATTVAADSATLNGVIDPNTIASRVRFGWGTSDAGSGTWANYTSYQSFSGDGDQTFTANISGLAASTAYFFRALAEHPDPTFGSLVQGSSLSFTTAASPSQQAQEEDHMHIYYYDAPYGATKDIYFSLQAPMASTSDRLLTTAAPFAVSDIKISKDGGAFADVANSVTQVTDDASDAKVVYKLTLSATEMQAEQVIVRIVDITDPPAFRDQVWIIRTKQRLGQIFVDATQLGSNNAAVTYTGVGTSPGLSVAGGATSTADISGVFGSMVLRRGTCQAHPGGDTVKLDSGANATDDYYNGCAVAITGGTGLGQFRIITDYTGATTTANVNRSWSTPPTTASTFLLLPASEVWDLSASAELSAMPTATSKYAQFLQFLFQRFSYKRDQSASNFRMFKVNDADVLASGAVSDTAGFETANRLT